MSRLLGPAPPAAAPRSSSPFQTERGAKVANFHVEILEPFFRLACGHPRIGIQRLGLRAQFFDARRIASTLGDPRLELGVLRAHPEELFTSNNGLNRGARVRRTRVRFGMRSSSQRVFFGCTFRCFDGRFRFAEPTDRTDRLACLRNGDLGLGYRRRRLALSRLRRPLAARRTALCLPTPAASTFLVFSLRRRRWRRLENFLPVEIDLGIVLLDPANRFFIQRRAAYFHARRRAKPVQQLLARAPVAAAKGMNERRCFVPAFVAGEPQEWQGYLRFGERVADFAVRRDFAGVRFRPRDGFDTVLFFLVDAGRARVSLGAR